MKAVITIVLLLVLMGLRVPVVFSMLIAGASYILFLSDIPIVIIAQRMSGPLESFPLLAVPLFVLAAEFMNRGMATKRIFEFATHCVGHVRGAMGHVNVLASIIFAGMSGSDIADAAGLGKIEIKAMVEKGYDLEFSTAVTGASSIIGPIIPPSVIMIIYGYIGEQSIGRLFLGGAVPGFIMGLAMMILIYFMAKKRNFPRQPFPGFRVLLRSFWQTLPTLIIPGIILGGIITGIFTPTESAVVAVAYTFVLSFLIYRDIPFRELIPIIYDVCLATAMIVIILGGASVFAWTITIEQIPLLFRDLIISITDQAWVVLLIINVVLLILGLLFGAVTITLIMTPVLIPLATSYGIDLIHLGVVLVLNVTVGFLTPPFGLGLFILSDVTGLKIERIAVAMLPFFIPILFTLLLITYVPALVLYLPNLLMGAPF